VHRVGVIGTGTWPPAIVEVFAKAGKDVCCGPSARTRPRPRRGQSASPRQAVVRGKLAEADRDAACPASTPPSSSEALADCDLVIRRPWPGAFRQAGRFGGMDGVWQARGRARQQPLLPLPSSKCAAATSPPGRLVGLHFSPCQVMKAREIVSNISTAPTSWPPRTASASRCARARALRRPGRLQIVNGWLFPRTSNDAVKMLEPLTSEAETSDNAMKVGCGLPLGPFEPARRRRLDVSLAIERPAYLEFRRPASPRPLLEHLVTAGRLGARPARVPRHTCGTVRYDLCT